MTNPSIIGVSGISEGTTGQGTTRNHHGCSYDNVSESNRRDYMMTITTGTKFPQH